MIALRRRRTIRTPTLLQMEAVECGAAALGIVLAHFGRWVPLEELRIACGVTRDGAKASNVLKAARFYGLSGKGFRKEPEALSDLPVPSILHWNFNHFLVFEGVHEGRAYLNDPATGRRSVSLEELGEAFTGVVLAFEPGETFARGGQRPAPWKMLAGDLRTARTNLALVGVFSLMLVVPGLIAPGLGKLFIDRVLIQQFESWVGPLCIGLALAGVAQAVVTALQQRTLLRLEARLAAILTARVLRRLLALPMAFFVQRSSGELANRVASAEAVARMLSGEVATSLFNLTAVAVYGLAIALFHPLLLVVALGVPILSLVVLSLVRGRIGELQQQIARDQAKLQAATSGLILGVETLKVSGGEAQGFSRWAGHQARCLVGMQRLGGGLGLLTVTPQFASAIGTAAVLVTGAWLVVGGDLTIGGIVAVQVLMASFTGPFNGLVTIADRLLAARSDLTRLADTLNYRTQEERGPAACPAAPLPPRLQGRVNITGLTFGYSRLDPPLIRDFSLSLQPGMRVALVGGSGSGKSTVGRLVAGLLPPWEGSVCLDGHPVPDLPRQVFANTLAYVDQDVFLFEGSVRDNLTLWNPAIPDAVLTQALKDAGMHGDITARSGHYNAKVAEGGANFSGGQRQRLEIARALVGDPSVLVLDEATAALDPVTEKALDDNLRRRGCTCIIIAHRLSTIRDCDEIIVLDRGRIAERGPHDTLIAAGGHYAALIGSGR